MNFDNIELAAAELRNEPWVTPVSMNADPAVRAYLAAATPTRVHELIQMMKRQSDAIGTLTLEVAAEKQRADQMQDEARKAVAFVQAEQQRYEKLAQELAAAKASIPAQTGIPVQQPAPAADERAAFFKAFNITESAWWDDAETGWGNEWAGWQARAALAAQVAAPVAGQEPVAEVSGSSRSDAGWHATVRWLKFEKFPRVGTPLYAAPVPAASVQPVSWKDAFRRCGANPDYHGIIAFTPHQLEHFVGLLNTQAQPDSGRDAALVDDLDLIRACIEGYPASPARNTALATIRKVIAAHPTNVAQPVSDAALEDPRQLYEAWELQEAARRKGEPLDEAEHAFILKRWASEPDTYSYCPHHWPAFKAGYAANVAQVGELSDLVERTVERLNRAQIFPLASEWSAILAAAKKGSTT